MGYGWLVTAGNGGLPPGYVERRWKGSGATGGTQSASQRYMISMGWKAWMPVPSRICWRQEVPGAATRVGVVSPGLSCGVATARRSVGKRSISPMAMEVW